VSLLADRARAGGHEGRERGALVVPNVRSVRKVTRPTLVCWGF
jgi:hypothetical protein